MKTTTAFVSKALALGLAAGAFLDRAQAQPTVVAPGFGITTFYIHSTTDQIVSYDWDSSANLYYMTFSGYPDVSVWKATGGVPLNIYANPNNFAGASVLSVGDYVYFNDSSPSNTQFIRDYGPVSGSPSTTQLSTTVNSGLYTHNGDLFITGAPNFGTNEIYYSDLAGDGSLTNDPAISLGVTSGSPGPLSFDMAGNLYYAPGYGDPSIYKWTALELAAAIADPSANALSATGHQWLDYSSLYGSADGATSMLFDANGDLLVTLTSFVSDSVLAKFGVDSLGAYSSSAATILTDSGRLGELRAHAGGIYISSDNQVVQIVPEPTAAMLAMLGLSALTLRRSRKVSTSDRVGVQI